MSRERIQKLVKQYQKDHNEETFNQIYKYYERIVRAYKKDSEILYFQSDDLAQLFWIKFLRNIDRFDPGKSNIDAWVRMLLQCVYVDIVRYAVVRHNRGQHSLEEYKDDEGEFLSDVEQFLGYVPKYRGEAEDTYLYYLDKMGITGESREYILQYLELEEQGYKYREIMRIMGYSNYRDNILTLRETLTAGTVV